ncbi:DUF6531 domain-containing protein [Burkholderia sp. AW49-1]
MALPAVKHLDPVVGVDVHSVLVTPGTPPVFLPHPHVGFMLDLREYVQAAKAVVGCIAMMIVQEKVTEYIEDHPEDVEKLAHLADEANQQVNDLMGGGKLPDFKDDPNVAEGMRLANEVNKIKNRISDDLGSNVGSGGSSGRPIFVNGMMRATAGTHAYHVPGLHFPLGESFAPPDKVEPSNDGESFMGSKTVLANNDPMSYMALEALSCWSVGMEPPPHNSAHTDRTYPSMPSSVMLPIPAGRPVLVGGPPIMNMAAAAKGLFKAFRGSDWAKTLADKLHLKSGFLRCNVLKAEPVDVTTGEVVVQQRDFTVMGRLPLVWERHYASHNTHGGTVGAGWQTPADIRLDLMPHEGAIGAAAHFPDHATAFNVTPTDNGWSGRTYDWQHGHALYCADGRMFLRTREGIEYEFVLPARWRETAASLNGASPLTLPLDRMADLNGNAWVFERDLSGSLVRLIEWRCDGRAERLVKCDTGRGPDAGLLKMLTLIDAEGNAHPLVSYDHDRERNLVAAINAMAHPHHFEYATEHRMVNHTSARGTSFYYSYQRGDGDAWRVDHAWGDNGLFDYRFGYNRVRMETRITNSLGYTSFIQMNERGIPLVEIDPVGGVTGYRYDEQDRASMEIDPAGRVTTWKYDPHGNLLAQTLPDGSVLGAEYDANHRAICVMASVDRQWHYEWDDKGNLIKHTTPSHAISCYAYDSYGQLVSHIGPRGAVTKFEYNRDGYLATLTDALGNHTHYTSDARGNFIRVVDALGRASQYEYDRNSNLIRSIEPGGREVNCVYDSEDNLVQYRDPSGNVTQMEYSSLGGIAKRTAPDGHIVEYRYDTEDQLIGVVNERGELYALKRDALGRIVEEIDYWGQRRRYEYGPAGELRRSIDPLQRAIEYDCDVLGRIVTKRVPDARQPKGVRTETFVYDKSGDLIVAENPDCRVALRYDFEGRLIEERQGDNFTIAFAYDQSGNRVERRTVFSTPECTAPHVVRYGYDLLDAVVSIQIDNASPITLERDVLGQVDFENLNSNQRRQLTYDSDGRLAKHVLHAGTGTLFTSEYAYDANGELIEIRNSQFGSEQFEYDPVGRITRHVDPSGKLHRFLHDPAGDLLRTRIHQSLESGVAREGSSNNVWWREGKHNGCHYTFDSAGNMVSKRDDKQDLWLSWDGDGLLLETIAERRTAEGASQVITQYKYDVFHRRIGKYSREIHTADQASDTSNFILSRQSRFFWDENVLAREISEIDGAGDRIDEMKVAQNVGDREWFYYPDTFWPLAIVHQITQRDQSAPYKSTETRAQDSDAIFFFHNHPNGEPLCITDASGNIIWKSDNAGAAENSAHWKYETFYQPLRLQGQYYDSESTLRYNRFRYFDSSIGAFISQDPIGLACGINPYNFAPNLQGWIDPLGLNGVYIFITTRGNTYIGKGKRGRYMTSTRCRTKQDGSHGDAQRRLGPNKKPAEYYDNAVSKGSHTDLKPIATRNRVSPRDFAEMVEARLMAMNGFPNNPNLLNAVNSAGVSRYNAASSQVKSAADAAAQGIARTFNSKAPGSGR